MADTNREDWRARLGKVSSQSAGSGDFYSAGELRIPDYQGMSLDDILSSGLPQDKVDSLSLRKMIDDEGMGGYTARRELETMKSHNGFGKWMDRHPWVNLLAELGSFGVPVVGNAAYHAAKGENLDNIGEGLVYQSPVGLPYLIADQYKGWSKDRDYANERNKNLGWNGYANEFVSDRMAEEGLKPDSYYNDPQLSLNVPQDEGELRDWLMSLRNPDVNIEQRTDVPGVADLGLRTIGAPLALVLGGRALMNRAGKLKNNLKNNLKFRNAKKSGYILPKATREQKIAAKKQDELNRWAIELQVGKWNARRGYDPKAFDMYEKYYPQTRQGKFNRRALGAAATLQGINMANGAYNWFNPSDLMVDERNKRIYDERFNQWVPYTDEYLRERIGEEAFEDLKRRYQDGEDWDYGTASSIVPFSSIGR